MTECWELFEINIAVGHVTYLTALIPPQPGVVRQLPGATVAFRSLQSTAAAGGAQY